MHFSLLQTLPHVMTVMEKCQRRASATPTSSWPAPHGRGKVCAWVWQGGDASLKRPLCLLSN